MRVFDALVSFIGRTIVAVLSLSAVIALATFLVVGFQKDAACKEVVDNPAPPVASTAVPHLSELAVMPNYMRGEQVSPLTFPEWYIVYNAREYAHFLGQHKAPTDFPFGLATAQYWCSYTYLTKYSEKHYPPDTRGLIVLMTIGASFSAENMIESAYEQSFGRLSGWNGTDTPEDTIQREEAEKYAAFLDTVPWYEYPFFSAVWRVWKTPLVGPHILRKWERKLALTIGYGMKGVYGLVIGKATHAAYAPADLSIMLLVQGPLTSNALSDPDIKIAKDFGDGTLVLEVPRYQKFSRIMQEIAHENISILDIAGGKTIVISASAPNIWYYDLPGILFFTQPLTVDQEHKRIVAAVPVQQLPEVIRKMAAEDVVLEHVYDY